MVVFVKKILLHWNEKKNTTESPRASYAVMVAVEHLRAPAAEFELGVGREVSKISLQNKNSRVVQ